MIDRYVSAEELRRLVAGLTGVMGVILVFALFALIVVPGLRNANQPPTQTPVESVAGSAGWLDPTEYPPMHGYEVPPLDPKKVMNPTPEQLSRGKALFKQYCVTCHGEDGRGDGAAAGSLSPSPRNFTRAAGWTNGPGRPAIFKTLAEGVPGSAMVSYDFLTKKDRMALVHYVRSFASFAEPQESPEALAGLAKELAAPGERVPNRIPVSMAESKLVEEYRAAAPLRFDATWPNRLRAVVADRRRAARVLTESQGWSRSPEALAQVLLANPAENGFRPAVAALSREEWVELLADLERATGRASLTPKGPERGKE